jgi:hypothetical protein
VLSLSKCCVSEFFVFIFLGKEIPAFFQCTKCILSVYKHWYISVYVYALSFTTWRKELWTKLFGRSRNSLLYDPLPLKALELEQGSQTRNPLNI